MKDETHGVKDWRRGVATAVVAGICSVIVLALFGPEDAELSEALVVGGSILGAYVLRPLAELAWNYIWGPWRALNEVISNWAKDQASKLEVGPEAANKRFRAVATRLEILRRLEGELRDTEKKISKALEAGRSQRISGNYPFWNAVDQRGFGGLQDMQGIYVQLRDCMDELDAIGLSQVNETGDSPARIGNDWRRGNQSLKKRSTSFEMRSIA